MLVLCDDAAPILFDLGTGARTIGAKKEQPLDATALVSHLHWDHVQGFPFCAGVLRKGSRVKIYGPKQSDGSFSESLLSCLRPPFFPVEMHELPCETVVSELSNEQIKLGGAEVVVRSVPHKGETNGYRVTSKGSSVAYVPDHQQPRDATYVDASVLELAHEVDLLIHDAQYTPEEFAERSDWGHCTVDYAVEVARQSGARCLALFHHDPAHDDEMIDELLARARGLAGGAFDVIAASEHLTLEI